LFEVISFFLSKGLTPNNEDTLAFFLLLLFSGNVFT